MIITRMLKFDLVQRKFFNQASMLIVSFIQLELQAFFIFVFFEHGSVVTHDHDKTTDEEDRQNRVSHKRKVTDNKSTFIKR